MKPLDIPVDTVQPPSGMLEAVLTELAEHLQNLVDSNTTHIIDLNSLPLSEFDISQLQQHRLQRYLVD